MHRHHDHQKPSPPRGGEGVLVLIRDALRRLAHPFPPSPLVANQIYSPLDAAAEPLAAAVVERTLTNEPAVAAIAAAHVRFLDHPEGGRCLAKGLLTVFEERLRVLALRLDPPERHDFDPVPIPDRPHPLDPFLSAELPVSHPAPGFGAGWLVASAVFWGVALIAKASWVLIRHGRRTVEPRYWKIAAQDFWQPARWESLVAGMASEGVTLDDLVFVLERREGILDGSRLTRLDPEALPVPRGDWLRRVMGPAVRLAGTVTVLLARHGRDARVAVAARESLHQAFHALRFLRTGYTLRAEAFLDIVEYNALHYLRAIILGRHGIRSVRLPYSEVDSRGNGVAWLGYDLYLGGGTYAHDHLRLGWSPRGRAVAIGQIGNDRAMAAGTLVQPRYAEDIGGRLARGSHMAVFFGSSRVAGLDPIVTTLLRCLWEEIRERPGWFLVVKPKHTEQLYRMIENDPTLSDLLTSDRAVLLRYEVPGLEVCHASWLIERMSLGASVLGSVIIESLTRGRPHVAYYPAVRDTPLLDKLRGEGMLAGDAAALRERIGAILDAPRQVRFDDAWFRTAFDPFGDDRALARMARVILDNPAATAAQPPPGGDP
ncbi:MAG: hypothetical protein H7840_08205 [Alphaproteobacteria bacterium]